MCKIDHKDNFVLIMFYFDEYHGVNLYDFSLLTSLNQDGRGEYPGALRGNIIVTA